MKTFSFHGVYNNFFKLDNVIWEAKEAPHDGYRSLLDTIEVSNPTEPLPFPNITLDLVYIEQVTSDEQPDRPTAWTAAIQNGWIAKIVSSPDFVGFRLIGKNTHHVWLEIGTEYQDEWYPMFTFRYTPMPAFQ